MADRLPLLIFPQPRSGGPPQGRISRTSTGQDPEHHRQVERLEPQMNRVSDDFTRFKGLIDKSMIGVEPELVLVLELANRIDNLAQAVNAAGLEWLGEWDLDMEIDDDFPAVGKKSTRDGRLFVSMANQQGMDKLLALWQQWQREKTLPRGKTKWRDIFACLKKIRPWGRQETLVETGMKDHWDNLSDEEIASFQIECFYHQNHDKRVNVENDIRDFLSKGRGEIINDFIDRPDIAFHAVKAHMPVMEIRRLLNISDNTEEGLHLFIYPNVMYFRQTGQSIATAVEGDGEEAEYPQTEAEQPPIAAILDGVPNLQHKALENHVDFDDPFNLANEYLPGERQHGTAMASLVIHGDLSDETREPIRSKVHHVAVMQVDILARNFGDKVEHFPGDCFYEDRIERAVRRLVEHDGEIEAQAPTVRIINLSLGDETRPFIHTPSPWARLLDWLSWKYRILFCVSAGNYSDDYDFGVTYSEYQSKTNEEKTQLLLKKMQNTLSHRRLLAPAESINALTIGALHHDESDDNFYSGRRIDLLPHKKMLSPISRLGHGFRRSIKPEIYFPGGRQLYREPIPGSDSNFKIDKSLLPPGQKVAWDSDQAGERSKYLFKRGTSNATALATHAGVKIYEVLRHLNEGSRNRIPDEFMAVVIKALLVHGSIQNEHARKTVEHLKNPQNSRQFKTVLTRFLGYGVVDVDRVLACTEQRGTAIGFGEITTDETHEYRFPVPGDFGGQEIFRRMVVTLAWFSPINPRHRYLREAKLAINPLAKWVETPLSLKRTDGDHHQVKRGTLQHEVLEGNTLLEQFQKDEEIVLQIFCKKDATENLEEKIPYGLAVTLEASEGNQIPVYEKIKQRLSEQIAISD